MVPQMTHHDRGTSTFVGVGTSDLHRTRSLPNSLLWQFFCPFGHKGVESDEEECPKYANSMKIKWIRKNSNEENPKKKPKKKSYSCKKSKKMMWTRRSKGKGKNKYLKRGHIKPPSSNNSNDKKTKYPPTERQVRKTPKKYHTGLALNAIPRFPAREAMVKMLCPYDSDSSEDDSYAYPILFSDNIEHKGFAEDHITTFNDDSIDAQAQDLNDSLFNATISRKIEMNRADKKVQKTVINNNEDICKLLLNLNTLKNNEELSIILREGAFLSSDAHFETKHTINKNAEAQSKWARTVNFDKNTFHRNQEQKNGLIEQNACKFSVITDLSTASRSSDGSNPFTGVTHGIYTEPTRMVSNPLTTREKSIFFLRKYKAVGSDVLNPVLVPTVSNIIASNISPASPVSPIYTRSKCINPAHSSNGEDEDSAEDFKSIRSIYFGPVVGSYLECPDASSRMRYGLLLGSDKGDADFSFHNILETLNNAGESVASSSASNASVARVLDPIQVVENTACQDVKVHDNQVEIFNIVKNMPLAIPDPLANGKRNKGIEPRKKSLFEENNGHNNIDYSPTGTTLRNIGKVQLWKKSLLEENKGHNNIDSSSTTATLRNIGKVQLRKGEYAGAVHIFQKLLDHEDDGRNAIYSLILGMSLYGLNKFDEANQISLQALETIHHQNKGYCNSNNIEGDKHKLLHSHDQYMMGKFLNNIGCGLLELSYCKRALHVFQCALHAYTQSIDDESSISFENEYSLLKYFDDVGQCENAKKQIPASYLLDVIITLGNLAYVLMEMKEYNAGIACLERSLILQDSIIDAVNCYFTIGTMESLASAYTKSEKPKKASEMYDIIRQTIQETHHNGQQKNGLTSNIHSSMSNSNRQNVDINHICSGISSIGKLPQHELSHSFSSLSFDGYL